MYTKLQWVSQCIRWCFLHSFAVLDQVGSRPRPLNSLWSINISACVRLCHQASSQPSLWGVFNETVPHMHHYVFHNTVVTIATRQSWVLSRRQYSTSFRVTANLDTNNLLLPAPQAPPGMWYQPVPSTLLLLSKLYRCIDTKTFAGLAQEAVAACTASVQVQWVEGFQQHAATCRSSTFLEVVGGGPHHRQNSWRGCSPTRQEPMQLSRANTGFNMCDHDAVPWTWSHSLCSACCGMYWA